MPQEEVTKRIGSAGKPLAPMEIKIVDDDDNERAPHEVGELLTRLPGRQREYYKDADATASTWTGGGWLRSGGLGYLDDDGFLYLVGRKKDLIVRGGHNVYPTDIESVILEHPAVREAAGFGAPPEPGRGKTSAVLVRKPRRAGACGALPAAWARPLLDYTTPPRAC